MFLLSPNLSDSGRHFVSVYLVNSSHLIGSGWVSIVFWANQSTFVICTDVTQFWTRVSSFEPVLHKNALVFSQSESSNFCMYIITGYTCTVEPRFNEVAGDRPNVFVKWRVRYIENLDITNLRGNDQNVRYIEVIVNDWFVTQVISVNWCRNTIVPMSYNKPLTERLLSLFLKDLLTVDLFSVYLLSRVDIVTRYIEVAFTFGLPD